MGILERTRDTHLRDIRKDTTFQVKYKTRKSEIMICKAIGNFHTIILFHRASTETNVRL